jgi:hypothetical protein
VKVVIALVCVLFLSLAGFGYHYFIKKKSATPESAPVSKPSVISTDSGKLNNFSTPKKPEQKQNLVEVQKLQELPQPEVTKEQKKQAPLPKVQKPRKVASPYEQNDSEEQRQYKQNQKYEKCRNQWCFGEVQGVSPVEAFKRCNDCEYLLR